MQKNYHSTAMEHPTLRNRSSSPIVRFRSPRTREESRPKAMLTTLTLLGVIYAATVSGGYGIEDSVKAGGPLLSIVFLCLIPFIWGIPVSLCVAELACAIPSNAGPVMWVNCAFPSWVTFTTVLWTTFLSTIDNSLYPTILADYCSALFELGWVGKTVIKVAFLSLCAIVNIIGFTLLGAFSVIIMILTIVPFVFMFLLQLQHGMNWERIGYVPGKVNWALFLPVVTWNFSGFEAAGNVIEEVQDPNPTYIRALVLVVIASLFTYIPPILAGASTHALEKVPFEEWSDGFWVKVGAAVGGTPMATMVLVGGVMSMLGLMMTLIATTSRSLAGMGTINAFPSCFSRWVERYSSAYDTPVNAILFNTFLTGILSIFLTFQTLVELDQVLYALRLITILASFLRLRIRQPLLERPYRAPGGTFVACLWTSVPISFSIFLLIMSVTGNSLILYSSAVLFAGTILISVLTVKFFRPDGFEGSLVEEYEDPDMQTYGSFLEVESEQWHMLHPTNVFIENPPKIDYKLFRGT